MNRQSYLRKSSRQRGVAAVEFALVATLLFPVLLGVMEMGRLLWTWNAAVEATRFGARLAAVCDKNDSIIRTRMKGRLGALQDGNILIEYLGASGAPDPSCTAATCRAVRVSLKNYQHTAIVPLGLLLYLSGQKPDTNFMTIPMPPFSTTLRRESMDSTNNEVCS